MSGNDLNPSVCRICGEKDFLVDILNDENYHLFGKLKELEGVQKKPAEVESFDEVFKFICSGCEHALEGFYEFRSKVRKMRRKLTKAAMTGRIKAPLSQDEIPVIVAEVYNDGTLQTQHVLYGEVVDQNMILGGNDDIFMGEVSEEKPLLVYTEEKIVKKVEKVVKQSKSVPEPEFIHMDYMLEEESSADEDDTPPTPQHDYESEMPEMHEEASQLKEESEADVEVILKRILEKATKGSPSENEAIQPVRKIVQDILEKTVAGDTAGRTTSPPRKKAKQISPFLGKVKTSLPSSPESPPKLKKCPMCGRKFALMSNYENHMHRAHGFSQISSYKCSFCDRAYKSRLNWEIHELSHKINEEGTQEQIEDLRARRSALLKSSIKKITSPGGEKPTEPGGSCRTCGATFKTTCALKIHMRGHTQNSDTKLKCIFCDQEFKTRGLMRFHQAYTHLNVET